MNVDDIWTRVQKTFGDEANVQISQSDVIRWINDAQREAVMQHADLLQAEGFINTVLGTQDYSLPSNLFTLSHVYCLCDGSYYPIRFMSINAFDDYIGCWSGANAATGLPLVYTRGSSNKITLFPVPDASLTSGIKLIYARHAVDVTTSSDPIDLPTYYHSYVQQFCLMNAYEMDEDWEASDKKASIIQSTLDFNNHRESWFGDARYPSVLPMSEDSE